MTYLKLCACESQLKVDFPIEYTVGSGIYRIVRNRGSCTVTTEEWSIGEQEILNASKGLFCRIINIYIQYNQHTAAFSRGKLVI